MVDPTDGQKIPCLWDDCTRVGDTRYEIVLCEPVDVDPGLILRLPPGKLGQMPYKKVHYLFCSETHRQFFRNSHIALGRLPSGVTPRLL